MGRSCPTPMASVPLEILYLPFVLFRRLPRGKGAKIAALAGIGIGLARIEAIFAGFEFADHDNLLRLRVERNACDLGSVPGWGRFPPPTDKMKLHVIPVKAGIPVCLVCTCKKIE